VAQRTVAKESATKTKLLDAAEQLMVDEGYAAVTSRRVGTKAGIAAQLVHYYFRTMDDLFLEVIRRRSEAGLAEFARAIEGDVSLRQLWDFQAGRAASRMEIEFAALANHRKVVGEEIAKYGERFRHLHADGVARALDRLGISHEICPPQVLTLLMTGVAQILALEEGLGMDAGHKQTKAFVAQLIDRFEPDSLRSDQFISNGR
jgi:TetR/AcrR family transcriptional regulator